MAKNYFFCYDKRLADFLRYEKNIQYITKAYADRTLKKFYLFPVTDELNQAIKEYHASVKSGKKVTENTLV
ncbi:hypothetical protein [Symbiobacterium thermophilum]|uniref:Uncharacterized protein n=1 Tax=Symbiobacterium thermophilum TaxID=2734 RepID=A0A953I4X0_SYMTR|nr:hypothetical protein [Symbiobacterium thermophilum]MBY6278447.1 hypothetical protein [Symbiobacterium thermophilum]